MPCYSASAAASAKGLPSESRHTAHRSPGWMIEPPSSRTRSSAVARSATLIPGTLGAHMCPLAINGKRVTCDGANVARAANMG
jgi:hypothetical protein